MAKKIVQQSSMDDNHEFEMKESIHIPDGVHSGLVKSITYEKRNDFEYVDIRITVDGIPEVTIKTGFPANISENSSLGKFLISSGIEVRPGKKTSLNDIRNALIDRKVQYTTYTEDVYARIVNKSIKFLK